MAEYPKAPEVDVDPTNLADGDHFAGMPDDEAEASAADRSAVDDDLAEAEAEYEAVHGPNSLLTRNRTDLIRFLTMILSNDTTCASLNEEIYRMLNQSEDFIPLDSVVAEIVDSFIDGNQIHPIDLGDES